MRTRWNLSWFFTIIGALLISLPGIAHVKWFVPASQILANSDQLHYSLFSPPVAVAMALVLGAIIVATRLDALLPGPPRWLTADTERRQRWLLRIFQTILGIWLLATTCNGALLVPTVKADMSFSSFMSVLYAAQAGIGILFIADLFVPLAALLLLLTYGCFSISYGFHAAMENINVIGMALALLFARAPQLDPAGRLKPYAIPALRVFTGIAVINLALTEKLLFPSLGLELLRHYNLNFMSLIGLKAFTDDLFILAAGFTEVLLGMVFVLGLVTRINTIALVGFFVTTNIYFAFVAPSLGVMELVGHLPVLATALLLIFHGSGDKLRIVEARK